MAATLWLYGPPGVGKTTVGWELFDRLSREGVPAAYVDIDQLGMCYATPTPTRWAPEPASDPGRHRLKTRNLAAVVANFQLAGAHRIVVSGVVDEVHGVDMALLPHVALTLCRLRADPSALRSRLASRGRPSDEVDEVLRYAAALDRNGLPGVSVDTTGRSVAEVVQLVRDRTDGWASAGGITGARATAGVPDLVPSPGGPVGVSGDILWLCGATGVGKSTVGWHIYERVRHAGVRAAFVDLDQIGFYRPATGPSHATGTGRATGAGRATGPSQATGPSDAAGTSHVTGAGHAAGDAGRHRLKAGNLAAVWRTFRARGAECLIAVGPLDRPDALREYTGALPSVTITLCRLHAGRDRLTERIMLRGRGIGPAWGLPGDELTGRPAAFLREVADRAAAHAAALDAAALGDLRVDTDDREPRDIADEILQRTGWPARRHPEPPP